MRNGDVAKINGMTRNGATAKQICEHFKNQYPKEEVMKFIPRGADKRKAKDDDSDE